MELSSNSSIPGKWQSYLIMIPKIVSKQVLTPGVGRLDVPQSQVGEPKDWRSDRQTKSKLANHLRRTELGQHDQHAPLAAGIDHIANECPHEIGSQT